MKVHWLFWTLLGGFTVSFIVFSIRLNFRRKVSLKPTSDSCTPKYCKREYGTSSTLSLIWSNPCTCMCLYLKAYLKADTVHRRITVPSTPSKVLDPRHASIWTSTVPHQKFVSARHEARNNFSTVHCVRAVPADYSSYHSWIHISFFPVLSLYQPNSFWARKYTFHFIIPFTSREAVM